MMWLEIINTKWHHITSLTRIANGTFNRKQEIHTLLIFQIFCFGCSDAEMGCCNFLIIVILIKIYDQYIKLDYIC